jgi:hypothetical protein
MDTARLFRSGFFGRSKWFHSVEEIAAAIHGGGVPRMGLARVGLRPKLAFGRGRRAWERNDNGKDGNDTPGAARCGGRARDRGVRRAGRRSRVRLQAWRQLRKILNRNFDAAAEKERADLLELERSLRGDLTARGMVFTKPDATQFRSALLKAGFYGQWQKTYGADAWAQLERFTRKLG